MKFNPIKPNPAPKLIPNAILLGLAMWLIQSATPSALAAGPFYWDNLTGAGFGTAGGTWSSSGNTGVPGWNADSTGTATPGTVITATTDTSENFGTGTTGGGLAAGTVTVSGAVNAGPLVFGSLSGAIVLSGGTSITLPASPPFRSATRRIPSAFRSPALPPV